MDIAALSLILAAIFVWGIIWGRAAAISTPIFFVAVGLILGEGHTPVTSLFPTWPDRDPHAANGNLAADHLGQLAGCAVAEWIRSDAYS